jgi:hypothetical protein
MKLTNRNNLPEPFAVAFGIDEYERGDADFTTTQLTRPPRIVSYTRKYWDQMEEDISDRVWAFAGQVKHIVLERIAKASPERYMVEHRFEITMQGGVKVSGKIDLYDRETRILYDWKESSVWKFIMGDTLEWEQQGNVNLFLMRMNDIHPEKLINVTWLKDWKKRLARTTRRKDYPQCAINVVELPKWNVGRAQDYILERIRQHQGAIENPPVCTKEERWQRDATFAVMRKGRKGAIAGGLCDNEDKAQAMVRHYNDHRRPGEKVYYYEERPAEPVRCLDFCAVQQFCDFGIKAVKKWRKETE